MTLKFFFLLIPSLLAAQPAFEAAATKPADPRAMGFAIFAKSPLEYELRNCSLLQAIETAWGLPEYAIAGPPWLDSVRFTVVAKLPAGSPRNDAPGMLQTLLADRFQLRTHTETREVPGYGLTTAKGGAKLAPPGPQSKMRGRGYSPVSVDCGECTMVDFIGMLTRSLGLPIEDETGLTGTYDISLRWTPAVPPGGSGEAPAPGPSVFNVLEDQLGLKLAARRVAAAVLVVDGANRGPSGN